MPRYGDLDALMEVIRENDYPLADRTNSIDRGMFTVGIQQAVDELPTADVAPVVHGRWIDMQDDDTTEGMWRCSACGDDRYFDFMVTNPIDCGCYYCSNCGAKMDGTQ